MTRIRTVGLTLIAILAMSAVVASAAFAVAQPEYIQKGKPLTKATTFTGKNSGAPKLVGAITVTCEADTSKGTVEDSTKADKIVVTFTGCQLESKVKCQTNKKTEGTIVTEKLKSKLDAAGETKTGETQVGNLFEPEVKERGLFAEFECGGIVIKVEKDLIGLVTKPIEKEAESVTGEIQFKAQATEPEAGCGKQQLLYVAGSPCLHLEAGGAPAVQQATETLTYAKALVIKP